SQTETEEPHTPTHPPLEEESPEMSNHPADRGVRDVASKAPTTTDGGVPVPHDEYSAQIGRQGAQPIHDFYLIEKLAHFNRENVPERIPHAKGSGAFGDFETTEDIFDIYAAGHIQYGDMPSITARLLTATDA